MNSFFYDSAANILSFLCLGVILGAVYDFFRVLRISRKGTDDLSGGIYDKIRPKKSISKLQKLLRLTDNALTFTEDILFWMIVFASEAIYIYYINDGEPRIDCFILSVAGFMLYRISIGRIVVYLSQQIIFFVRCLLFWTTYIIMYPVRIIWKFIYSAADKAVNLVFTAIDNARRRKYSKRAKKRLLDMSARGFEQN